jgi:virginiamycin B lyase
MQSRYQRILPFLIVLLGAAVGVTQAVAQTISEFPVPTPGSQPAGITTGPDGNLWFTETVANQIGRITTAGVIKEFPTPAAGSQPKGIT